MRRPITPKKLARRQAEEFSDTTGGELSAVRHLFAAIEAGIRTTAPPALVRALLATMRDQQRATEAEIIERGKRRRQHHREMQRRARRFCKAKAAAGTAAAQAFQSRLRRETGGISVPMSRSV